jgi:hypothetical protein
MRHINFAINAGGGLALAHPHATPRYGAIIRITDVPPEVTNTTVHRQAERCAYVRAPGPDPFRPTIVAWAAIEHAVQGQIISY